MDGSQSGRYYAARPSTSHSSDTKTLHQSHSYAFDGQMDPETPISPSAESRLEDDFDRSPPYHGAHSQSPEYRPANDSYTYAAPSGALRSFAERARGRPELSLDTSPPIPHEDPDLSSDEVASPSDEYAPGGQRLPEPGLLPTRRASVPERSPLQKLETTLGDISKEEKRARVEHAEQRSRQRSSLKGRGAASPPSQGSSQAVHRKPVPQAVTLPTRFESQRTSERGLANSKERESQTSNTTHQTVHTSWPEQPKIPTLKGQLEKTRLNSYTPTRTRGGGYGHDAALTGGAAAAAVDALQAARRQWRGPPANRPSLPQDTEFPGPGGSATRASQSRDVIISGSRGNAVHESSLNRAISQPSAARAQVQNERPGKSSKSSSTKIAEKFWSRTNSDVVSPDNVRREAECGTTYEQPPQTEIGSRAREQVGFGVMNPNEEALEKHRGDEHRRVNFSDIIEENGHLTRRYDAPQSLEEWRSAGTAALYGEELDLDSNHRLSQTQNGKARRVNGRSSSDQGSERASYGDMHDESATQTTFQPPLRLKCGPLLRYTGISRDSSSSREIWRGSIMIVTEDSTSIYERGPTLRLFKQPMDLLPPPPSQINGAAGQFLAPEYIDPLAGHPKMSRTGKTLYVRPVHHLQAEADLSRLETDEGLFEHISRVEDNHRPAVRVNKLDGERLRCYREVQGFRLHAERGVTFWRFNIQVELGLEQTRIAYRINRGPAIGFWVPAVGQTMNVIFHSCNGFSMGIDSNLFSGPDPLWRDVLNNHQTAPFHCMIGGGDQIYNDAAMRDTQHFQAWLTTKNPIHKHSAPFTDVMQDELERFYLDRYSMWFSQGLFGMANSQIPMVNMWDDHDIIDGFGSYPHHFMHTPVFAGLGAVAFKYYMLFQHQSVPDEDETSEPSWVLGTSPGPYIHQFSRSLLMSLGKNVLLLALDCRTERMHDEVLSQETYDIVFDRCRKEIIHGETKHMIVLLGIPIAYPRLNWLENVLTSKAMEPFKLMGRMGMLGNFVNKFDGGVEILDDLDDHWTARHHKQERNWFIQELQELAAEKSVRITILGGDVHLAAIGQFYSNPKLGIPKDHDHRYMPNVISSAIVNTPPPVALADVLNRRNKVHHLDRDTDEDMIPIFSYDVDGRPRKNQHLLPRRNWCTLREYQPGSTPPPTPPPQDELTKRRRSFSLSRSNSLTKGDSHRGKVPSQNSSRRAPPTSFRSSNDMDGSSNPYATNYLDSRTDGPYHGNDSGDLPGDAAQDNRGRQLLNPSHSFRRRPNSISRKASVKDKSGREGHIDLQGGLEITINCEVDQKDPSGVTAPYRLLVPALYYDGEQDANRAHVRGKVAGLLDGVGRSLSRRRQSTSQDRSFERSSGSFREQSGDAFASKPSLDGHDARYNDYEGVPRNPHRQSYPSKQVPNENDPQSTEREKPLTTASLQRASIDSAERAQMPSDSVLERLPRSQAPFVEEPLYRRPSTRERRNSMQGPPPPANIEELPVSVQKRYSQLNDPAQKRYDELTAPTAPSSLHTMGAPQPAEGSAAVPSKRQSGFEQQPSYSPPTSFNNNFNTHRDRHYSSGPMESPLLPANVTQLMSSDKRHNFDPMLIQQSQQSSTYSINNNRRAVSGPAASNTTPRDIQQSFSHDRVFNIQNRHSLPISSPLNFNPPSTARPTSLNTVPPPPATGGRPANSARNSLGAQSQRDPYATYDDSPPESPDSHAPDPPQQSRASKLERHFGSLDGAGAEPPRFPVATTGDADDDAQMGGNAIVSRNVSGRNVSGNAANRQGVVYRSTDDLREGRGQDGRGSPPDAASPPRARNNEYDEEEEKEVDEESDLDIDDEARARRRVAGRPAKVARHFVGYDVEAGEAGGSGAGRSGGGGAGQFSQGRGSRKRVGGLGGLVRRLSESGGAGIASGEDGYGDGAAGGKKAWKLW